MRRPTPHIISFVKCIGDTIDLSQFVGKTVTFTSPVPIYARPGDPIAYTAGTGTQMDIDSYITDANGNAYLSFTPDTVQAGKYGRVLSDGTVLDMYFKYSDFSPNIGPNLDNLKSQGLQTGSDKLKALQDKDKTPFQKTLDSLIQPALIIGGIILAVKVLPKLIKQR